MSYGLGCFRPRVQLWLPRRRPFPPTSAYAGLNVAVDVVLIVGRLAANFVGRSFENPALTARYTGRKFGPSASRERDSQEQRRDTEWRGQSP